MIGADMNRKPRMAMMGEFSAGKSTLSNLLLGQRALPEKVTATRLPPVWIVAGTDEPYRVDIEGNEHPVSLDRLEDVPLEETLYVRLSFEADILEHCDLIDFPGISDPNMASEIWERMLGEVDGVLWCTHATQAWRQSEAAVWDMIPEEVRRHSLLLITRFDKLITDNDKMRVRQRVTKETAGLFSGIYPISLTQALAADEGDEVWETSGAHAFYGALAAAVDAIGAREQVEMPAAGAAEALSERVAQKTVDLPQADLAEPRFRRLSAVPIEEPSVDHDDEEQTEAPEVADFAEVEPFRSAPDAVDEDRIIPRRVRPSGFARTPRPSSEEGSAGLRDRLPGRARRGELDNLRTEFRRADEGAVSN